MAKTVNTKFSKSRKVKAEHFNLALTKLNYSIIGIAILLIIIGYIFMSEKSVDGFGPTVIAPILLVLGYCVFIPVGILYKGKLFKKSEESVPQNFEGITSNSKVSSNIKTN
ncbi:MAG TPA: hypothetical protein VIK14_04430 [Ignavibacteria bacterium]